MTDEEVDEADNAALLQTLVTQAEELNAKLVEATEIQKHLVACITTLEMFVNDLIDKHDAGIPIFKDIENLRRLVARQ